MTTCDDCYGSYHRTPDGEWLYQWGQPVPGARDLTVRDVLPLGPVSPAAGSNGHVDLLADPLVDEYALHIDDDHNDLDRVIGVVAPELHVRAMLTISDVAKMVGVEPNTIAAYRYRGYLPEPQAIIGRAPVWSRPVIHHWLETRPGNGWRTDIYGSREEHDENVRFRRAARQKARRRRSRQMS